MTNRRVAKWRGYALNVLLLVVLVSAVRTWQHRDMASGAAPTLQGTTLAGTPYRLAVHPERPVLVHFWATWCPVCRAEQSTIAAIAHDRPDTITVAMQSGTAEQVVRHMTEQGIALPVLNDPDGRVARAWGVHAVPASFIIDTDGQIRFIEVGYTSGLGLRLRLWWAGI